LLIRTPRGRCLSPAGWSYLGLDAPAEAARQLDLLASASRTDLD
jgi:Holliday junction DNA helicase RuvB